jgi:hypothetical protein
VVGAPPESYVTITLNRKKIVKTIMPALALAATALLAYTGTSHAALTTPVCLAKKLNVWGNLRKCQTAENGKALQARSADPAKCQTKFDLKLAALSQQAAAAGIRCRYGVNGDGTATDYDTGLVWEQKTDDGSVHGNMTYSWTAVEPDSPPNGTAFTVFLGTLNNGSFDGTTITGCFAGHCDWRLPAIDELAGIVDRTQGYCGGGSGPCIDQAVFGPTAANFTWSATTYVHVSAPPDSAWLVDFYSGLMGGYGKGHYEYVRAVRSGL